MENKLVFNILILVFTLGLSTVAQAQAQSPNVYLQVVDEGGLKLKAVGHNNNNTCDAGDIGDDDPAENGYLCFKKGNSGLVNLHLIDFGHCRDQVGYKWNITKVTLGGEGSKTKPAVWGGLSKGAAQDLGADASSGEVDITPDSGSVVHFKNDNVHEIVFWYTVEAICSKGNETYGAAISLDPRGRNGGTN